MSTFKDMNRIVVVALLQLANMNHKLIIFDDEVQARDGHRVLGPSLVNCRKKLKFDRYVQLMRELRIRELIFKLHENGTQYV